MRSDKYRCVGMALLCSVTIWSLACVDGGENGGEVDAGADAGSGESLSFIALATRAWTPIEGATIAVDLPGGERVELSSAADGRATVDGIRWADGALTATAYAEGHAMVTYFIRDAADLAHIPMQDGAIIFRLLEGSSAPPPSVTVSGTATGLGDPGHDYVVNVLRSAVGTEWGGPSTDGFSVTAPADAPFVLQGLDLQIATGLPSGQGYTMPVYGVVQRAFDATSVALTDVTLDFVADAVPTSTAEAWIGLPSRAESPLRVGSPVCLVSEDASLFTIGWSTHLDISADGNRFDISFLWTEPSWAENVFAFCRVSYQAGSLHAYVQVDGYPQGGDMGSFVDAPNWVVPDSPSIAHPLGSAIGWEAFDADLVSLLQLRRGARFVWFLWAGPGVTSMTAPELPSVVDRAAVLGSQPLSGNLVVGDFDAAAIDWTRYAQSSAISLQP